MKRITKIINCLGRKIKKYFFKSEIEAETAECRHLFSLNEMEINIDEISRENEYFDNYKLTTRWQTV